MELHAPAASNLKEMAAVLISAGSGALFQGQVSMTPGERRFCKNKRAKGGPTRISSAASGLVSAILFKIEYDVVHANLFKKYYRSLKFAIFPKMNCTHEFLSRKLFILFT